MDSIVHGVTKSRTRLSELQFHFQYICGIWKDSTDEPICRAAVETQGFPGDTSIKNPPASAGDVRDVGLIPGLGRSPGGGYGNLLQYSCLENPMDRGA